jgi:hypothetical protein
MEALNKRTDELELLAKEHDDRLREIENSLKDALTATEAVARRAGTIFWVAVAGCALSVPALVLSLLSPLLLVALVWIGLSLSRLARRLNANTVQGSDRPSALAVNAHNGREDISRGMACGSSIRDIAKGLQRAASTHGILRAPQKKKRLRWGASEPFRDIQP